MTNNPRVSIIIPTLNRSKDVLECLGSILKSDYEDFEVIVVDNASTDNTVEKIERLNNKKIKLIKKSYNAGAGGGRNIGAQQANGKYLLFIDSDNIVDKEMVKNLVNFLESNNDCGMVGPLMYQGSKGKQIWLYSADINMVTSKAEYKGTGEKDQGQLADFYEVGHLPNCFMLEKKTFNAINGFDEKYKIMYEEADLGEKVKRLGKTIYLYTKAKTYHNVSSNPEKNLGIVNPERGYLIARNRIYFMKKNANFIQKIAFFVLNSLIITYYLVMFIKNKQFSYAKEYLKGSLAGLFY